MVRERAPAHFPKSGAPAHGSDTELEKYYLESGTPPASFIGAGLGGLDEGRGVVPDSAVSQEHLHRMLGKR